MAAQGCQGPPQPLRSYRADGDAKVDWAPRERRSRGPALYRKSRKRREGPWGRKGMALSPGSCSVGAIVNVTARASDWLGQVAYHMVQRANGGVSSPAVAGLGQTGRAAGVN